MSDFYLSKYPVVSESGKEYRVDVCPDHIYGNHVMCGIFEVQIRRNIFGVKREKLVQLNNTSMFRDIYKEDDWNYDYTAVAKNEIKKYENRLEKEAEQARRRKDGVSKFNEWDGRSAE